MQGGVFKTIGKKKARIEIIPLIDVIFFLLATFVLFTLSLNRLSSVPVQLPYSDATPNPNPPKILKLQISDGDTVFFGEVGSNSEPISIKELRYRLTSYQQAHPKDVRILITTDDQALFGQAVAVLDQIRLLNIDQVSIDTSRTYQTGH
ncbi:MAG TPA: biopolymer transporter ExbD [Gemmataceae bacterium]|jgi:biopolymer transport protein ExbD|nr:biopolymer transporter ExbD [Gemmataceae bacterium]